LIITGNALLYYPDDNNIQMYALDQYAINRSLDNQVTEVITEDKKSLASLNTELRKKVMLALEIPDDTDLHRHTVRLFTYVRLDPDNDKLIPKSKKEISSDSLQSAYDEDATFRTKGKVSQSGYALEVSETCSKDNSFQLITDYDVAPNNTSDVEIFENRIEDISKNTGCKDMYLDGEFHSH